MTSLSRRRQQSAAPIELLEPRQLRAGTPTTTEDVHLLLNNDNSVVTRAAPAQVGRQALSHFTWYDGTPNSALDPMSDQIDPTTVSGYYLWPIVPGVGAVPGPNASETSVRLLARIVADSGQDVVVLDNETWHFDVRFYSRAQVDKTIADMKQVIGWIRDEEPELKIGIYGYMSQSDDYASAVWQVASEHAANEEPWWQGNLPDFADRYADWQANNDYMRPLADSVDYMFPVLYTGYDDIDGWERSAKSTIEDSRRYGKPVIPFIWPYYHEAAGPALAGTELPTEAWQRELELVRDYGDGALIWSSRVTTGNEDWVSTLMSVVNSTQGARAQSYSQPPAQLAPLLAGGSDHPSTFGDLPIDGQKPEDILDRL